MYPYDNNPYSYSNSQYPTYQPYLIPTTGMSTSRSISQNQNTSNQVIFYYVQNKTTADNWLLGKNERVYLMDSNEPVMYLKATDQDGRYFPMRTFDLVERKAPVQGPNEAPSIDTTSFVKRDEIPALVVKAVDEYLSAPAKKEA